MAGCPVSHHGVSSGLGCKHLALGKFGRLLPDLESNWNGDAVLRALGASGGLMHDSTDASGDAPDIPAGYTFFAQFVDHDVLLADELIELPDPVVADRDATRKSLAFRNLIRGRSLGLPSGQDTARALADKGYPIDCDLDLFAIPGFDALEPAVRDEIKKASPLFFYLTAESTLQEGGQRLGATGSAILLEVFVAMLKHCGTSFLEHGKWQPDPCIEQCDPKWGLQLADIVRYASG